MTANRLNRWDPLNQLRTEMTRLFDELTPFTPLVTRMGWRTPGVFPALNVWEDQQDLFVEAELPGMKLDDLHIFIQGDELTLRGNRRAVDDANSQYLRRERSSGEFVRYLTLPFDVDPDKVEATLRDGVLMIRMPKSERAKARRIQVRAENG